MISSKLAGWCPQFVLIRGGRLQDSQLHTETNLPGLQGIGLSLQPVELLDRGLRPFAVPCRVQSLLPAVFRAGRGVIPVCQFSAKSSGLNAPSEPTFSRSPTSITAPTQETPEGATA